MPPKVNYKMQQFKCGKIRQLKSGITPFTHLTYFEFFSNLTDKGMIRINKKYYNIVFLFIFLFVILFINFFHTEKTLAGNDNCPACQFLNSSLTTSQINFFHLPSLSVICLLESSYSFNYTYILFIEPTSRSPPQV